jgi:hypothetical protein
VKRSVDADVICSWAIYLRGFGEFILSVVIREMHSSHEASRTESGLYFVVYVHCVLFLVALYFFT